MASIEAGYAVAEGFKRADNAVEVDVRPLADGGVVYGPQKGATPSMITDMDTMIMHRGVLPTPFLPAIVVSQNL
jgi:glycerate kinase